METYPTIGEKVYIIDKLGEHPTVTGVVTNIFPPNENHSGRFKVHMHEKYMEQDYEFWYSDYNVTVMNEVCYKYYYGKK